MKANFFLFISLFVTFSCFQQAYGFPQKPEHSEISKYDFEYSIEIPRPQGDFGSVRVWIPLPVTNHEQKILSNSIDVSSPYETRKEKKFGNSMIHLELKRPESFPVKLNARFQIERKTGIATALKDLSREDDLHQWEPKYFMGVDRNVPINGLIHKLASEETSNITDEDEKIRKLYSYVVNTMAYNKEGSGWGRGDAIWACTNKRGNCTDFHSLLVGMARSQKIPAKFEIGFSMPDDGEAQVPGYHCWARVFSKKQGWIPVDASEAKKKGLMFEYFGKIPANRIQFTTGRDLVLDPPQNGEPLNYFIYPYVEVDGKVSSEVKNKFYAKKVKS